MKILRRRLLRLNLQTMFCSESRIEILFTFPTRSSVSPWMDAATLPDSSIYLSISRLYAHTHDMFYRLSISGVRSAINLLRVGKRPSLFRNKACLLSSPKLNPEFPGAIPKELIWLYDKRSRSRWGSLWVGVINCPIIYL